MNKNLTSPLKNKPYRYYVLDLDWLLIEASETYVWKVVPFRALVELLLFSPEEVYLERLHLVHKAFCTYHFSPPPVFDTQEALEEFWSERRLNVLYRLEMLLDINDIEGGVAYHNWLPCNHLILKKVDKCYIPPLDHLVTGCLF